MGVTYENEEASVEEDEKRQQLKAIWANTRSSTRGAERVRENEQQVQGLLANPHTDMERLLQAMLYGYLMPEPGEADSLSQKKTTLSRLCNFYLVRTCNPVLVPAMHSPA